MSKCIDCKHKAEEGYISFICLECRNAYFQNTETYEKKADLYLSEVGYSE